MTGYWSERVRLVPERLSLDMFIMHLRAQLDKLSILHDHRSNKILFAAVVTATEVSRYSPIKSFGMFQPCPTFLSDYTKQIVICTIRKHSADNGTIIINEF